MKDHQRRYNTVKSLKGIKINVCGMYCRPDQNSFYGLLLFYEACTGPSSMNAAKFKLEYTLRSLPSKAV